MSTPLTESDGLRSGEPSAALPISGLTPWQGLFEHGRLEPGQTVLIHGAAGGVGSIAVRLAREAGARIIGTGRAGSRSRA
jgi:NADPH:quinone reductase-like Zn-dependent oxidoreductase